MTPAKELSPQENSSGNKSENWYANYRRSWQNHDKKATMEDMHAQTDDNVQNIRELNEENKNIITENHEVGEEMNPEPDL